MSRKRILFVTGAIYPDSIGGMQVRAAELVELLKGTYDVILLTHHDIRFSDGSRQALRVTRDIAEFHWPGKRDHKWLRARTTWMLKRRGVLKHANNTISNLKPSLVYLHRFEAIALPVLRGLVSLGVPLIARFGDRLHTHFARIVNEDQHNAVRLRRPATCERLTLIFNCDFTRRVYVPLFHRALPYFVIYQGIDERVFHRETTLVSGNHFAFLGRAQDNKGFLDFCRVMVTLPGRLVQSVRIIADGPHLEEGVRILRQGGKSNLLAWVGAAPRGAAGYQLRQASILVHPSHEDTLGTSVLEGMASGLAVVASDVGGTSEAVHHGRTGLLVPPQDYASLVRTCWRLAESPDLRVRLGREAHQFIASRDNNSLFPIAAARLISDTLGK